MKTAPTKTKGKPDEIDVHVGNRLKVRRSLLGLSQEKIADAIGLTFQQVQKYEKGVNRISAGRLYQFSRLLDVPVSYFYENANNTNNQAVGMSDNGQEGFSGPGDLPDSLIGRKDIMKLLKIYQTIENQEMRDEVIRFTKSMADLSKK